jgi:hypothetical protein
MLADRTVAERVQGRVSTSFVPTLLAGRAPFGRRAYCQRQGIVVPPRKLALRLRAGTLLRRLAGAEWRPGLWLLHLNPTVGIIDFNASVGQYLVQGTVDTGAGPSLVSLLGNPSATLRLTNFIAEAVGTPTAPLGIQFFDTAIGTFTAVQAADSLDAYSANSLGAPNPFGTDFILDWQGFMTGLTWGNQFPGPPPYFNPAVPPLSPPLPYGLVGHNPTRFPVPS